MSEWREVIAEDFCDSVRDGTHDSPKQSSDIDAKYLITSRHLLDFDLDFQNAYKISMSDFNNINKRSKVDQWDILFSMIGTVGRVYQIREANPDYVIKNIGLFKTGGDEEKSNWLKYFLISPNGKAYIEAQMCGSTQSYVPLAALRKMPINIPPLPVQRAIAEVLSSIDDKIDLLTRQNATLEALAQTYFRQWFVEEANEDWHEHSLFDLVNILGGGTPSTLVDELQAQRYLNTGTAIYRGLRQKTLIALYV